jgi:hypothetical protein
MALKLKRRRTLVCIARYLEYPSNKKFSKTVELMEVAESRPETHIKIAVTGAKKTPLDSVCEKTSLEVEHYGDLKLPKKIAVLFEESIVEGYESFVLIDDDAYIPDINLLVSLINEAFDKHHAGAAGPMTRWRFWAKAKSDPAKAMFRQFYNSPWTSLGCQCYDIAMLKEAHHLWRPLLDKLDWRSDHSNFIMAHSLGYKPCEVYLPEYDHTGSSTKYIYSEPEWERRMLRLVCDYTHMLRFAKTLSTPDFYYAQIYRLGELELLWNTKPLFKKLKEVPLSWRALASTDFAETLKFYKPLAKERGLI